MKLPVSEKLSARFERGFKTWCENTAISLRAQVGLSQSAPLKPEALGRHLGVRLWTPQDVPQLSEATIAYLTSEQGDEWSAVTVRFGGIDVVVVNSRHSTARQASSLMHEFAHILRNHEPSKIYCFEPFGIGIRTFDPLQEAEADWLSGCLLLPRPALFACVSRRISDEEACQKFGVSSEMYRFRLNMSGVKKQFGQAT